MIRTLALATAALAAAASMQLAASPAGADTNGSDSVRADSVRCVSYSEFQQTEKGMAKFQVHQTFGTSGTFGDGGAGGFSRLYEHCGGSSGCQVMIEYFVGPAGTNRVASRHWNGVC